MTRSESTILSSGATLVLGIGAFGVPLAPPHPLTREDGSFDHERANLDIARTAHKHRQNLLNLGQNPGHDATFENEDDEIMDLTDLDHSVEVEEDVPLTSQSSLWTVPITIGSNHQPFAVAVDTGSSDLWIPSVGLPSSGRQSYNPSPSTTSRKEPGDFQITYGNRTIVSGAIYSDTIQIGSVEVPSQRFSAVASYAESFSDFPADGVLGLAYQSVSKLGAPPFIQNAAAQGKLSRSVFALKLAASGASLHLGGADDKLFAGSIEYHPVVSQSVWMIGGASISVNGKIIASGFRTIIDSSTSFMYGPHESVAEFYTAISGSKLYDKDKGWYTYPSDSPPKITVTWGGRAWRISPESFDFGTVGDGQRIGALASADSGQGSRVWVLGDSFMRNVYTVFNFETNAVGFAELA